MINKSYRVEGPGILRARQEAASKRKILVFAYDQDLNGQLLRVGYYLEDKNENQESLQEPSWFNKNEINI